MSIESSVSPAPDETTDCSAIELVIHPVIHDLGGFSVRRALPSANRRLIGPWIFFDHFGPATFPDGEGVDVRPHPHINLATVTYLFAGEMLHRDSLGNEIDIRPGEINLMVAGKGIVHSERQREAIKARNNTLHGLQLWLALPEADEEIDPEFHHYAADDIPQTLVNSVPVRVMIGHAYGLTSPVKTFADTLYVEAHLQAGQQLQLPDNVEERGVYIASGRLSIQGRMMEAHTLTALSSETGIILQAEQESRIAIIGGKKLSQRHIWWNYVSSRKQRIEQAKDDWREGRFPKVPGDEVEFIPLPDK